MMVNELEAAALPPITVRPIFGDFFELEHVCELLHEQAKVADAPAGHPVHENGPVRLLLQLMRQQREGQEREIESAHPGLFSRTYLADIYREAESLLCLVDGSPAALPENLARLELLMHKLYILPLRDFDEARRELERAAKAVADAKQQGVESEKAARSQTARNSVKARGDQLVKAAFLAWARSAVTAGKSVDTVNELQGLDGFDPSWSSLAEKTLKAWAKEAGFAFKSGRPKKKK